MLRMSGFEVRVARSAEHALELWSEVQGAAWLAGGTDILPAIKQGVQRPERLIALHRALPRGARPDGEGLLLGAGTRLVELAALGIPALSEAAATVASPQIRNMGTLGGNVMLDTRCRYYNQSPLWRQGLGGCLKAEGSLCHVTGAPKSCVASQCADTIPALLVLGARLRLLSPAGSRELPLSDFLRFDGLRPHAIGTDELLVGVWLPGAPGLGASAKLRPRGSIDFPQLSLSAFARLEGLEARIEELRLAVGATNPQPRLLPGLDAFLGQPLDEERIQAIGELCWQRTRPQGSLVGDPGWRRQVARVFTVRLLHRLRAAHEARA